MLILQRHIDEEIWIDGGRVRIRVVDIRGDKVRLGITAPVEVPVDREEIAVAKQRDRERGRV